MAPHSDDQTMDIVQRLARLEVKVDQLLEGQKKWFEVGVRTWIALIGAIAAIAVAFIK